MDTCRSTWWETDFILEKKNIPKIVQNSTEEQLTIRKFIRI